MPTNLDKTSILPLMRDPIHRDRVFRLVWIADLDLTSFHCYISVLFKNIKTNFYIEDVIPPELLHYCSVGSYFQNGKKIKDLIDGTTTQFEILTGTNTKLVEANEAFTDTEYDLSYENPKAKSRFIENYAFRSKRQYCLVFDTGDMTVIIPCAVIAGSYYLRSTSLREAIFSMKLERLYEAFRFDSDSKSAMILMRQRASDVDAKHIARFLASQYAMKQVDAIRNRISTKGNEDRIIADFPVEQKLTIKARGRLTTSAEGRKTFIVFEILKENSAYPFKTLEIARWEKQRSSQDTGSKPFPVPNSKPSEQLTPKKPARKYMSRTVQGDIEIENPNDEGIKQVKISLQPEVDDASNVPEFERSEEEVDLSPQPETSGDDRVARGNVKQKEENEEKKPDYQMSLEEFEQMVRPLENEDGVTSFTMRRQLIWIRSRIGFCLSLRESYDRTKTNRRQTAIITFQIRGRNVCICEVDQTKIPGSGCSTYILTSDKAIDDEAVETLMSGYVTSQPLGSTSAELLQNGVKLETKYHPKSSGEDDQMAWRKRVMRMLP